MDAQPRVGSYVTVAGYDGDVYYVVSRNATHILLTGGRLMGTIMRPESELIMEYATAEMVAHFYNPEKAAAWQSFTERLQPLTELLATVDI